MNDQQHGSLSQPLRRSRPSRPESARTRTQFAAILPALGWVQFGRLAFALCLVCAPLMSANAQPTALDEGGAIGSNRVFDDAIEAAQLRTVKIYGASVGRVEGYGTGILVSNDGMIISTAGVYLSGRRVRVGLPNGELHDAKLIRTDRLRQLALLKIDAETPEFFNLQPEPVGDVGDWVVTFSNAFKVADGEEPMSVNLGIVSLRTFIEARRNDRDIAYRGKLVLIDAITSNPGASGGAVVKTDGELVGMIGKLIESSDTNTRLNYAVPNDLLLDFVENRLTDDVATAGADDEPHKPAELGIRLFGLNGPRSPAYVDRVARGSPAFQARIRPDDLIISVGGQRINTIKDYQEELKRLIPGESVVVVYKRGEELVRVEMTPVEKK